MGKLFDSLNLQERLTEALPLPEGFTIIETGHYVYWLNGAPAKIVEPWLKAQNAHGQLLTHSARFADDYGISLLVSQQSTLSTPNSTSLKTNDFVSHMSWQQQGQSDISAAYQFCTDKQQLNIEVKGAGKDKVIQQQRAQSFLYFPLLRVFSGDIIHALDTQGPLITLVPDIRTPQSRQSLLHPSESVRSAKKLEKQQIRIADKDHDTHRYAYLSEHYQSEDDATFWLNSQGLLIKYCWQQSPQQYWEVTLQSQQQLN